MFDPSAPAAPTRCPERRISILAPGMVPPISAQSMQGCRPERKTTAGRLVAAAGAALTISANGHGSLVSPPLLWVALTCCPGDSTVAPRLTATDSPVATAGFPAAP